MIDWNDIRYLVAVAEHGSTLAASRELSVSQTTVARRIAALEQATGLVLVDRHQAGYRLTPAAERLLDRARAVTEAAQSFEEAALSQSRETSGTVRLTTEDIFGNALLTPLLGEFHSRHPDIRVDVETTSEIRDLGAGEADVALRGTLREPPAGTVGRRLCGNDWTLYCSRSYAEAHGIPRTKAELAKHAIIGGGGGSLWRQYQRFLQHNGLEHRVTIQQGTSSGLLAGVRAGLGIGVLPCIVADGDEQLVRCLPPINDGQGALWLLTHERVRHQPAVRAVVDFLYEKLGALVARLGLD